jgi:hypothetical protein
MSHLCVLLESLDGASSPIRTNMSDNQLKCREMTVAECVVVHDIVCLCVCL